MSAIEQGARVPPGFQAFPGFPGQPGLPGLPIQRPQPNQGNGPQLGGRPVAPNPARNSGIGYRACNAICDLFKKIIAAVESGLKKLWALLPSRERAVEIVAPIALEVGRDLLRQQIEYLRAQGVLRGVVTEETANRIIQQIWAGFRAQAQAPAAA